MVTENFNERFTFPNKFIDSFRYFEAKIAVTMTLSAPRGVTSDAGANIYAAKLKNSPNPTKNIGIYKLLLDEKILNGCLIYILT